MVRGESNGPFGPPFGPPPPPRCTNTRIFSFQLISASIKHKSSINALRAQNPDSRPIPIDSPSPNLYESTFCLPLYHQPRPYHFITLSLPPISTPYAIRTWLGHFYEPRFWFWVIWAFFGPIWAFFVFLVFFVLFRV